MNNCIVVIDDFVQLYGIVHSKVCDVIAKILSESQKFMRKNKVSIYFKASNSQILINVLL